MAFWAIALESLFPPTPNEKKYFHHLVALIHALQYADSHHTYLFEFTVMSECPSVVALRFYEKEPTQQQSHEAEKIL